MLFPGSRLAPVVFSLRAEHLWPPIQEIELDRRVKEETPKEALDAAKAFLRSVLS